MNNVKAFSAAEHDIAAGGNYDPRRDLKKPTSHIDILFTGICHSDLHYAGDEWHDVMPGAVYPALPAARDRGSVTAVRASVTRYKTATSSASGAWSIPTGRVPAARRP